MNLRILKKLSKRASPLLVALGGYLRGNEITHFTAGAWGDEGHTSSIGHDRKHWDRSPAVHDEPLHGSIVRRPRDPTRSDSRYPFIHIRNPWTAWPGTPMVGWTSGYECPEWEERTAWEHLTHLVWDDVAEYVPDPEDDEGLGMVVVARQYLRNPAEILRHAASMAAAKAGGP